MKMSKLLLACGCGALLSSSLLATTVDIVVGKSRPKKAYDVVAKEDGTLSLTFKKGSSVKSTLKRGKYRVVKVYFGNELKLLEMAIEKQNFATMASEGKKLFNKYKWLNAGVNPGIAWADGLLGQGKTAEAKAAFDKVSKFVKTADDKALISFGMAKIYKAEGKNGELAKLFPRLLEGTSEFAAFVFNTQGELAIKRGDQDAALRAYMKTHLLFSPDEKSVKKYRAEAKAAIIKIFKAKGDSRAKTFGNEK